VDAATIFETRTVRGAQNRTAVGTGPDADSATTNAEASVPKDAVDVCPPKAVQDAEQGAAEVDADTEAEARLHGRGLLPEGAKFKNLTCLEPATKGFLGFGKKPGRWSVSWSTPFRVEIAYQLPAEVAVSWFKQEKD